MPKTAPQTELFAPDGLPEGFRYAAGLLSAKEEAVLVAKIGALPFKPFEFHGYLGNRRIVSFGYRYDYAGRALRESDAMPPFVEDLRARAASFAGMAEDSLQQVLVTEYAPGAGIGWHRDKPMFQDVIAFSFLAPCVLRFRRKDGALWLRRKQIVEPRSAYLLSGAARWDWYHSIPPLDALRYSITFRNFVAP